MLLSRTGFFSAVDSALTLNKDQQRSTLILAQASTPAATANICSQRRDGATNAVWDRRSDPKQLRLEC